jgi:nucleotide-binding universal stress UspA family protein
MTPMAMWAHPLQPHRSLETAMNVRPSILCPVDFSDGSAGALRYAAAIASHFLTRLIVLTVEDPLLTEAADLGTGIRWNPKDCKQEMARFAARTLGPLSPSLAALEYDVAVGKPAPEILRVARERSCDLIVISTHGLTGIRKLFFGSTTERVLRETTRPVLITPPADPGQVSLDDAKQILRRIVVPVDLTPGSRHQAAVAAGLAQAAGVPLILVHVIEPVKSGSRQSCTSRASKPIAAPSRKTRCRRSQRVCRRAFSWKRCWPTAIPPRSSPRSRTTGGPAWSSWGYMALRCSGRGWDR